MLALLLPNLALTLHTLNLEHIANDGSTVTVDGHTWPVLEFARPPLRAQLQYRRAEGAHACDSLIPRRGSTRTHLPLGRHTTTSWARYLSGSSRKIGLVLSGGVSAQDWTRQHGIRITPIADRVRRLLADAA